MSRAGGLAQLTDWDHIRALMREVAEQGEPGWHALVTALEPEIMRMAQRQRIGRLRDLEDSPREIVLRVFTRLRGNDFAAIHKLFGAGQAPPLDAWLAVLVKRSAIDYMREHPEFQRGSPRRDHRWISLEALSTGAGKAGRAAPDSLAQKRREVAAFMTEAVERARDGYEAAGEDGLHRLALEWQVGRTHVRRLAKKGRRILEVLDRVLQGHSYPRTAELLGLSRRDVELSLRYIEAFLRARRFADE